MPRTEPSGKGTLLAGPFVGELGWECFSFQPLVRGRFLAGGYGRCVVYTGPGRRLLYRFAETRSIELPSLQGEFNTFHEQARHIQEHAALVKRVDAIAREEFGRCDRLHALNLDRYAYPYYELGMPDLLTADQQWQWDQADRLDPARPTVAISIRDRQLAPERNWPYERWRELAGFLAERANVIAVGVVRSTADLRLPAAVLDVTNRTSIDDLINLYSLCDLVVGGSSGPMHLASRCGCDHLVWGIPPNVSRYYETNWFAAKCRVYPWGWQPPAGALRQVLGQWFQTGSLECEELAAT